MVPCGTWISSEMSKSMPEGVQLRFFLPPAVPNPVGDPSSLMIGVEPWMVPSKAKHKEQAIEIFKHMTSLSKAKQFVQEKGTLMAIKGSDEGVELPADLQAAAKAYKESKYLYANQFRQWYKTFNTELEGLMASLLEGKITPQQFCDGAEAQAEKVRKDETITKHKTG
jgi:N-acetylglucosamine transport system substrate-binding protein